VRLVGNPLAARRSSVDAVTVFMVAVVVFMVIVLPILIVVGAPCLVLVQVLRERERRTARDERLAEQQALLAALEERNEQLEKLVEWHTKLLTSATKS
jgi:cytochrome c oxidase assembly factor CtaG